MSTMTNLHRLQPCALCPTRLATPGSALCIMCDAVTLPGLIPDDIAALMPRPWHHLASVDCPTRPARGT